MAQRRGAYRILVRKQEGKKDLGVDGKIILKFVCKI
jgi:hypothetical protein